jgi:hypothetical protein
MKTIVVVSLGTFPLSREQRLKSACKPPVEFLCRLTHHGGFERLAD